MARAYRFFFLGIALLLIVWAALTPGAAQEQTRFTVSKCPDGPPPVPFTIDCSHTSDPAARAACRPFLENAACKVAPAYRKITGVHLEDICKSYQYIIYDDDNWPYKSAGAGGMTTKCLSNYEAKYSVLGSLRLPTGPYDVHEILHGHQPPLGRLPDIHVIFTSSMAEATRLAGDEARYKTLMRQIQEESQNLEKEFQAGKIKPENQCKVANTLFDELLYLKDTKVVYEYYEWLLRNPEKPKGNPQARFNQMFNAVSKGEARKFMAAHGCNVF